MDARDEDMPEKGPTPFERRNPQMKHITKAIHVIVGCVGTDLRNGEFVRLLDISVVYRVQRWTNGAHIHLTAPHKSRDMHIYSCLNTCRQQSPTAAARIISHHHFSLKWQHTSTAAARYVFDPSRHFQLIPAGEIDHTNVHQSTCPSPIQ